MKKAKIIQTIVDDSKKILISFKKLPWILGSNAFRSVLFLIILSMVISGFLFYKYAYIPKNKSPRINLKPIIFDEESYQEVLNIRQSSPEIFVGDEFMNINDPFR